jgi:outer membrane protein assembly factor BamB
VEIRPQQLAPAGGLPVQPDRLQRRHLHRRANGYVYALNETTGVVTTINGVRYNGSVRMVNPATGSFVWQTGLPGKIIGTPGLDGAGVIAASSYGARGGQNGLWLINAASGQIRKSISYGASSTFAQPVFADNYLFTASQGTLGLNAYTVGGRAVPR